MAYATYQCPKCKSSVRVGGYGYNRSRADSYAEYCESQGRLCSDCHKKEFQAEHAAKVAAAAADPRTATLPALTGTEKQIAWAQSLRLEAIPKIEEGREALEKRLSSNIDGVFREEMLDAFALIALELTQRTSASEWIDTRHNLARHYADLIWSTVLSRPELIPLCMEEDKRRKAEAQKESEQKGN